MLKRMPVFAFLLVLLVLLALQSGAPPGGPLLTRAEAQEPVSYYRVVLDGGMLTNPVVREAVLFAVPWVEVFERLRTDPDAPLTASTWEGEVLIHELRELPWEPERSREMLAEAGLEGRIRLNVPPVEERPEAMEVLAHTLAEVGIEIEWIETRPGTVHEVVAELIASGRPVLWLGPLRPARPVELFPPAEALFVSSWAKVPVRIDPASGLTLDDLQFVIPAGKKGGEVSLSKDRDFDPANPDIMLLAGHEPGSYRLQAFDASTGVLVAEAPFEVNALWPTDDIGPSHWVSGDFELFGVPGSTWGGGSTTEPDNYNVKPAKGTNQVAVLLLDTKSQRIQSSAVKALQDLWKEVAFDGHTHNGKTVSTAHYFREASYNKFNFKGKVFGPASMPGSWSDYLQNNGNYKASLWKACSTAGNKLIKYGDYKHLVCVVQTVDATATTPRRRVWAHADTTTVNTDKGTHALGTVVMPSDGTAFGLSATLAHELGHNLGLGDIYAWGGHTAPMRARQPGGWALMAHEGGLPHPLLVHRMKLGWVPKATLKLYNFKAIGGFVDETVTLHPIELANPPSGRRSGVEIRIKPGWDYYFEYRVAQASQIGDQSLPTNDRVLGTDVTFAQDFENPSRRKPVMLLANDDDGDGPVLGKNQDYSEQDISKPNFPTDFTATVTDIDGTKAKLKIQYGVYSQPDPSIRTWNPPVYQSPDIEVRNARNKADSKWRNVPWENHINTVVAKVKNVGDMNAPQVRVDFYVKDYTVNTSGVPPVKFGTDTKNVGAGKTVEFSAPWRSKKAGHYCIEVRIRLYQTPGPNSVVEATEYNNRAQSNYDRFISEKASPASRETALVKVHNPFSEPARIFLRMAKSTSPLFRTYLEHSWLRLGPGETKNVRMMFEYAVGEDTALVPELEQYISLPNNLSMFAVVEEPGGEPGQAAVPLGGVSAQVVTGRATRVEPFSFDPPATAAGQVVTQDTHEGVSGGQVILILATGDQESYRTTAVASDGTFTADASGTWDAIKAYYVPAPGYADSESDWLERR
ncbi:MAG: CARDB domain-containing protein [Thermoanaerobaculia bacterium]